MPTYRYAYDDKRDIVDVLILPADRSELSSSYRCIGCNNPLIARTKGEKREKHFAHKPGVACNPETYLHRLGKDTFYHVYQDCMTTGKPFVVELEHPKICSRYRHLIGHRCPVGVITREHNLTDYFDSIKMETRDDAFIPDLLLYNANDPSLKLYIEIAVTHFLTDEKQDSGQPIIEIEIESEEDVDRIKARHLTEADASFENFHLETKVMAAECECERKTYYCFMIFKSGKCYLDQATLREYDAKRQELGDKIVYWRLLERTADSDYVEPGELFEEEVEKAYNRGFKVRNCLLCRYHGRNYSDSPQGQPVYCKIKKRSCSSNDAAACEIYRV